MGGPARRSIREELLAVPGIAGAEFEGDPALPAGVRVQLAPGANAEDVGRQVRRVLAGHGMRSQMNAPAVAPRQAPPPPEPRTVINLADHGTGAASAPPAEPPPAEDAVEAAVGVAAADEVAEAEPPRGAEEAGADRPPEPGPAAPAPKDVAGKTAAARGEEWVPALGDVSISQRGNRVKVVVAGGERVASRPAVASRESIDGALLEAVCEILDVVPVPDVLSIETSEQSGTAIVTVLVDGGSGPQSGSAVVRGSRAWAMARAFWSAVSGPA